jgi:CRP/FNR family transcriptional regulator, dissimilatory nitrate respiration regulator
MDYSILSDSPLFKGLYPDEVEDLLSHVPHKLRKYSEGSMIALSGDIVSNLLVVISGTVKGEMVDYAGRVIKIEDIPAPGALASAFLFGSGNRFPVNVVAMSETELLCIEKTDFLKLLKGNETILANFLNLVSNRSQFLSEKIKFLNFKTIKGKLAHYILQKAGKEGTEVNLVITQGELADFFGVARPSVARAIKELELEYYIEAQGKKIRILDKDGLADLTVD